MPPTLICTQYDMVEAITHVGAMQDAWWLIDHKTKRTVEETLGLSGVLTFTVREGQPLHLTREQVATLSVDDFLQLWQVSICRR